MKRKILILFLFTLFTTLFTACSSDNRAGNNTGSAVLSYSDFSGKRVGVVTGSVYDELSRELLGSIPAYYTEVSAAVTDLRNGRIDGIMYDLSMNKAIVDTPGNEELDIVVVPAELFSVPMAAMSTEQRMIDRFNVFLFAIEADGTLAEMQERWLGAPVFYTPMPQIPTTGENGVLTVVVTGAWMPFSFIGSENEVKGYCAELALRFAAHEGMRAEFSTVSAEGFISYVVSGRADIGIDAFFITEERKQSVMFTDPYYHDQASILVLKQAERVGSDFIEWLQTGIQRNLITDNRWRLVTDGLFVTMQIAFWAQLLGTIFGAFVCYVMTRRSRFLKLLGNFYCGLVNGTPVVVLLMIAYYIIFGSTSISNVIIAVAAFALITGAGVAGILKGAIETVDPVEIEAARSMGFSAYKAFLTVTLPQAVRRALPGYTNGFVELVKATAIVGYIAIQDLTRAGDIIRSRTYDSYFPILFIAVIYLVITTICVQLFKLIVRKVNGRAGI